MLDCDFYDAVLSGSERVLHAPSATGKPTLPEIPEGFWAFSGSTLKEGTVATQLRVALNGFWRGVPALCAYSSDEVIQHLSSAFLILSFEKGAG
jgi:hypothetical protein